MSQTNTEHKLKSLIAAMLLAIFVSVALLPMTGCMTYVQDKRGRFIDERTGELDREARRDQYYEELSLYFLLFGPPYFVGY